MRRSIHRVVSVLMILAAASASASAKELSLASVFGEHMVVQRGAPISVWGKAKPGGTVAVTLGDKSANASAGTDGRWHVELKSLPAGGPYELVVKSGDESISLHNVLSGDVFLCSGQSNMQFTFGEAAEREPVFAKVKDDASLRLLMVPKAWKEMPADDFSAPWTTKDAQAINTFSAVGIFFAAALRQHEPSLREVPIGLVDSSFGGTRVEGWIPQSKLAPFKPEDLHESMFGIKPTQLFNAMIAPLSGVRFKGVLWYQGESNTAQAALYPELLGTMIGQWREDFRDPSLPFYLVQLANFPDPWESYSFAWLREAQAKTAAAVDDVHLAVAIDTPDGFDLHPRYKSQLGDRLARLAAKYSYGKDVVAEGPIFRSATPDGGAMRIEFDVGKSPLAVADGPLSGFDLAGEDGIYYAATASRVDDHTIRASSEQVPAPRFVSYAFRADPASTVVNRDGLPAAPFRTDSAPQVPMCEVQPMRPARRVITPTYSARVDADGRLASLQVNGSELLSPDDGGGFVPIGGWGVRKLLQATDVGPQSVRFFDSSASITYTFSESDIRITIANDSNEPLPTRFILNPLVTTTDKLETASAYAFVRDANALTISGADSAEKLFDVAYQIKADVKPHASRELTLHLSKPQAK